MFRFPTYLRTRVFLVLKHYTYLETESEVI